MFPRLPLPAVLFTGLQFLTKQTHLFYYLYATPSLYGGGAALAFFVAVCAFTWLEESTAGYGWEGRVAAVILSGVLIGNAAVCFVLGAIVPPESVAIEGIMVEEHRHDGTEGRQMGGAGSGTGPHSGNQLEHMPFQDLQMPSGFLGLGFSGFGLDPKVQLPRQARTLT